MWKTDMLSNNCLSNTIDAEMWKWLYIQCSKLNRLKTQQDYEYYPRLTETT